MSCIVLYSVLNFKLSCCEEHIYNRPSVFPESSLNFWNKFRLLKMNNQATQQGVC